MKSKAIEVVKTIIILLLLILLVFNVYLLFIKSNKTEASPEEKTAVDTDYKSYLKPYKIRFSMGKNTYFMYNDLDEKIWESLTTLFKEEISQGYQLKKISQVENIEKNQSMLVFSYSSKLPLSLFNNKTKNKSKIDGVKDLYFFTDHDNIQIVVGDGEYLYSLKSKNNSNKNISAKNFAERINEVISSTSTRFKQASYLISGDQEIIRENRVLFPARGYYPASVYQLKPEFDFSVSGTYGVLVNKVFDLKSPFVKEAENAEGDRLYLSEHGSDVLRIAKNGYLEYKIEYTNKSKRTSLKEDLLTAIAFNAKFDENERELRLDKVKEIDKNNYFERTFYFSKNDKVGKFQSGYRENGISIKIDGGDLVEYKRYMPVFVEDKLEGGKGVTYDQNTVLDMIAKQGNFEKLKDMYLHSLDPKDKKSSEKAKKILSNINRESVAFLLKAIDDFEYSYYELVEGKIRPCYIIKISDSYLIIDFFKEEGVLYELG